MYTPRGLGQMLSTNGKLRFPFVLSICPSPRASALIARSRVTGSALACGACEASPASNTLPAEGRQYPRGPKAPAYKKINPGGLGGRRPPSITHASKACEASLASVLCELKACEASLQLAGPMARRAIHPPGEARRIKNKNGARSAPPPCIAE